MSGDVGSLLQMWHGSWRESLYSLSKTTNLNFGPGSFHFSKVGDGHDKGSTRP